MIKPLIPFGLVMQSSFSPSYLILLQCFCKLKARYHCAALHSQLSAFFFCSSIHMDWLSPSNSSASLEFCYQIKLFFAKDVSPSLLVLEEYVNELYSPCLSCCHFCAKAVRCGKLGLGLVLHSFFWANYSISAT